MVEGGAAFVDLQCRDHHCSIDRISVLPDELLVFILSFLPLKEATATSILSRRWRYLSTFVPKLDFDGMESLLKVIFEERKSQLALDRERSNFIRRVNHVIALHKGSTIKEFRVVFNLTKTYQECIDEWLRYALSRKVQRLELILTYNGSLGSRVYDECYTFPYKLLRTENVSNCSESCSVRQCKSIHFNYLKKISMKYVNVNGEALEFFLCNSPLLEDLSVCQSGELSTLKITGPFPSFKRLEISFCNNLNSVEIRDANLVCLKYEGARIHFLLENVPLLVEIFVGGMLTERMEDVLFLFSSCLPQLDIFTIVIMDMFSWEETEKFYSAVKMSNLKQLVVEVWRNFDTLLPLTNLICASPCLQRFVLMASHSKLDFVKRKIEKIVRSYPHLKKVEFVGYRGVISELELVMHFLENAVALEKILVDPHERDDLLDEICYRYYYIDDEYIEDEISARRRAKKQLSKKVPPRINLKIL